MSLSRRENTVFIGPATGPTLGGSYTVAVGSVGARASAASSGTTVTVDAGHSFVAGDLVYNVTSDTFIAEAISSVTATTLVYASATPTITLGDQLFNLGPDTSVGSTPNYDALKAGVYSDPDGGTALTNPITCDSLGNYSYYHKGGGRMWELVRDSSGSVQDVIAGYGGQTSVLNVSDFGALSDGSSNDAPEIDAAILAANSVGGGTVFFPEGDHFVSATINLKSNVNLLGAGKGSKISMSSTTLDILTGTTVTDIEIRGLFFQGGSKNQSDSDDGGDCTAFTSTCERIHIDSCHFEKFDDVIVAKDSKDLNVTNCTGKENAGAFCRFLACTESNISDCQYDGARTVGDAANSINFAWFSFNSGTQTSRCSITSNQIKNVLYEAINLIGSHCTVTGNIIESNGASGAAINMQSNSTESAQPVTGGSNNVVSNNVIRNCGATAIRVGISTGNNTVAGHNNIISGNTIDGCTTSGVALETDAYENVVIGNVVIDAESHGIALGSTAAKNFVSCNYVLNAGTGGGGSIRGILVQGGAGNVISGNYVRNSDTHGIYMNGTTSDTSIIGNVVVDSGGVNATIDQNGITDASTSTRTFISGNKCWSEDGTHQKYAITSGASTTGILIVNNDCRNNTAADGVNISASATTPIAYGNRKDNTSLTAVASAATITIPPEDDVVSITGTTNITSVTASPPGRVITLIFASTPTFTDGSNLKLAGNLVATADDSITLVSDGTNWIEMARSVN